MKNETKDICYGLSLHFIRSTVILLAYHKLQALWLPHLAIIVVLGLKTSIEVTILPLTRHTYHLSSVVGP